MKSFVDFMGAALPWIAIGLALAVFFARSAGCGKKEEKRENSGTEGTAPGKPDKQSM